MLLRFASLLSPFNIILDFRKHLGNYDFFKMHLVIKNGTQGFFKVSTWCTQHRRRCIQYHRFYGIDSLRSRYGICSLHRHYLASILNLQGIEIDT